MLIYFNNCDNICEFIFIYFLGPPHSASFVVLSKEAERPPGNTVLLLSHMLIFKIGGWFSGVKGFFTTLKHKLIISKEMYVRLHYMNMKILIFFEI